jgi:hypothetical protein
MRDPEMRRRLIALASLNCFLLLARSDGAETVAYFDGFRDLGKGENETFHHA